MDVFTKLTEVLAVQAPGRDEQDLGPVRQGQFHHLAVQLVGVHVAQGGVQDQGVVGRAALQRLHHLLAGGVCVKEEQVLLAGKIAAADTQKLPVVACRRYPQDIPVALFTHCKRHPSHPTAVLWGKNPQ